MYFLVPYQLTGIQKGIQAGHAALEYAHKYKNDPDYIDFIENWKTWIILNGGTTNNMFNIELNEYVGSLDQIHFNIKKQKTIKHTIFNEPDLNNALTAICLVVDERVFNREKYPDYSDWLKKNERRFNNILEESKKLNIYLEETFITPEIHFLKELLNTKKLA